MFGDPKISTRNRNITLFQNPHPSKELSDIEGVPIASMYGIFTYIYHKNQPDVGKYTIHGSYGVGIKGLR